MNKPVEILSSRLNQPSHKYTMLTLLASVCLSCTPPVVVEGPPSLAASLTINQETLEVSEMLNELSQSVSGVAALRRSIMLKVLKQRSRALGKASEPSNIDEWREQLSDQDKKDAVLYAWAAQIIDLKSIDESSLLERFRKDYPQSVELIGRQISLTPQDAWTEDHYQRHLGALRSAARLKLNTIRHQVIEGKSFESLARDQSHHPSGQAHGGLVSLDTLRAEGRASKIISAVKSLRAGELSPVLQDEWGMYLFTNEATPTPMSLDAEGVFIPHSSINTDRAQNTALWVLLETLCDQSSDCEISDLLPLDQAKNHWSSALKTKYKSKRDHKKRRSRKRRHRLNLKAKGDTRSLSGRERSWADLPQKLFESIKAEYHPQLSQKVISSLFASDRHKLLERSPLFKALPMLSTDTGVWLIRLRGRTVLPALASAKLRMIYLDLTRKGLKSYWGTWGVERIGMLLKEAASHHRLDEALSTLGIQSSPISPRSLKPTLLKELLSISLESGPRLITRTEGDYWIMVKLEERRKVSFNEKSSQITARLQTEKAEPIAIRSSLRSLWESLDVELFFDHNQVNLDLAAPLGFTRPEHPKDD